MTETKKNNRLMSTISLSDGDGMWPTPADMVNAQICPGCDERFCPDISADMDGSLCAACEEKLMDADTAWVGPGAAE